jgi:hypothetical protein
MLRHRQRVASEDFPFLTIADADLIRAEPGIAKGWKPALTFIYPE